MSTHAQMEKVSTHKEYKSDTFSLIISLFAMVAHFICVLFTGFIIYHAWPGSSLFSWHPTLMSLAFVTFMVEAILLFSPQSSLLQKAARKTKTKFHWITQVLALTCALGGVAAIYYNKELNGKPHFTTWHGLLGICSVGYVAIQAVAGVFLLYPKLARGLTLAQMKMYHATSGLLTFMLVSGSLVLGMYSTWFTSRVDGVAWYACIACPQILLLAIMVQITNAYAPKMPQKTQKTQKR